MGDEHLSDRSSASSSVLSAPLFGGLGVVWVCSLMLSSNVIAAPSNETPAQQAVKQAPAPERYDYRNSSDAELTQLVKNWARLSPTQRRSLLSEVRSRMKNANSASATAASGKPKQPTGDLNRVMAQQTYGRTVRRPDGSVVTETETIKITPQGRQVTRQTTIRPPKAGSISSAATGKGAGVAAAGSPGRHVVRAKVRFGAGFEHRQGDGAKASEAKTLTTKPTESAAKSESPQR